jgi:hypothetical protein
MSTGFFSLATSPGKARNVCDADEHAIKDDWCATCRRRPCRRYADAQLSGRRWCQSYEYENNEEER